MGTLMYAMTQTRPHLTHLVFILSKFTANLLITHTDTRSKYIAFGKAHNVLVLYIKKTVNSNLWDILIPARKMTKKPVV